MKIEKLLADIKMKNYNLEKNIEVKKYIPIDVKKKLAEQIIFESTIQDGEIERIDTVEQYKNYIKILILYHTNLEYENKYYDILVNTPYGDSNLLNTILDCFSADIKEFMKIFDFVHDDYIYKKSIEVQVEKFLFNINNSMSGTVSMLQDKLKNINLEETLNNIDMDKLQQFLSKNIK